MADAALSVVRNIQQRESLRGVVRELSTVVWQRWLARRPPEDNRVEHEWVVLGHALRIAEDEGLSLSEKLVVTGFTFLHDTHIIPRITEWSIRSAADDATRERLAADRQRQRQTHMEGGAANTRLILSQLRNPFQVNELLFSQSEIDRCAAIVAGHDLWKIRKPHPPGSDRLAVVCLEADALWPLHPLGVLADLERPDEEGRIKDVNDPGAWQEQIRHNLLTLLEYRSNWDDVSGEVFRDAESIFRTSEGHRLYRQWRALWGV